MLKIERMKNEDPIKMKVADWSEGKRENLRGLLISLHEVLWEGAKWEHLTLDQVCLVIHCACMCVCVLCVCVCVCVCVVLCVLCFCILFKILICETS